MDRHLARQLAQRLDRLVGAFRIALLISASLLGRHQLGLTSCDSVLQKLNLRLWQRLPRRRCLQ